MLAQKKLLPRGPVAQWFSKKQQFQRNVTAGISANSSSYACGRSIATEEQRCGMLLTLRELHQRSVASTTSPSSKGALSLERVVPRLPCVIKAQSSDWQFNEVQSNGRVASLQRVPKARWTKVARRETVLIEQDSNEQFGDPSKSFAPRTQNHGTYTRRKCRVPEETPVAVYSVYRDSYALSSIKHRMRYELGVSDDATTFDCEQSGFGCVTQSGYSVGVALDMLPHASRLYNILPIVFDPIRMVPLESVAHTHASRGCFFRMVLRCVRGTECDIRAAMESLSAIGFVNYFDASRFMITSNHTHEIAAYATTGDYHRAVALWLQCLAERNSFHHKQYLQYLNAIDSSSSHAMLVRWAREAKAVRVDRPTQQLLNKISTALSPNSTDASVLHTLQEVFNELPFRRGILQSGAEFIWNAMASQRLVMHGLRVVVGDVVRVAHKRCDVLSDVDEYLRANSPELTATYEYKLVASAEEAKQFTMEDVVLPVPHAAFAFQEAQTQSATQVFPQVAGVTYDDFKAFGAQHRLQYLFQRSRSGETTTHLCNNEELSRGDVTVLTRPSMWYRPLIARPELLRYQTLRDPNSFTALKSDLFMLQERKPLNVFSTIDANRIREPCVYNVSERFAETMKPIVASSAEELRRYRDSGKWVEGTDLFSVVVTGFLPHSTDATTMLREAFDAKHATFYDLLEPSWSP